MAKDQPEALATFAASARNDGQKPKDIGLHATDETEAIPTDPKKKADAATKVLREGVRLDTPLREGPLAAIWNRFHDNVNAFGARNPRPAPRSFGKKSSE